MASPIPPSSISDESSCSKARPIANFHPHLWGDQFLNYTPPDKENIVKRKQEHESLKSEVRKLLFTTSSMPLEHLLIINAIERLGVAYHFGNEIEESLRQIYDAYKKNASGWDNLNLFHTCLRFRMLRQHGYHISSDVFINFTDEHGNFLESLKSDTATILSLYDAAYIRGHGEDILEKAVEFTTAHLKVVASQKNHPLAEQIDRALVYPLHRGVIRIESRKYLSYYEQDPCHNVSLLRFAKLDFDLLQSLHKEELQELTKWWRNFDFPRKFPFIRDRVAEAYLFAIGVYYEPKFSIARIIYTKAFMIVSVMDDIYDSFGTTEELEVFTKAIDRWDKDCMAQLPDYMKLFYEIQYDTYFQFEHDFAKRGMRNYVHYAVQEVITLSKAYFQEAKWRGMKYIPTFDEYFKNAIKSSACTLLVVVSLLYNEAEESLAKKAIESVSHNNKPQRATCIIGRFMDDLADYKWDKHRDHVAGGVDCYMKQYGVSEEEAYAAINQVVDNAWKDVNEEIFQPITPVSEPLLSYIYNFCRILDYFYKNYENGYTVVTERMKEIVKLLFIEPLSL